MESDHERREIRTFLQGVIADLHIGYAEGQGEVSLLLEKCRSGDAVDIDGLLEDLRAAAYNKGYRDGLRKMASDIFDLID